MSANNRQAVIIVHGIGEQRPMITLRGFVESVLHTKDGSHEHYWSQPDNVSGLYELRRIKVPERRGARPATDFYEYYWAQHMRDTKARQVLGWLWRMLTTVPVSSSFRLKGLWLFSWASLLSVGAFLLSNTGVALRTGLASAIYSGSGVALAVSMASSIASGALLYSVGDAARYLEPTADNIAQREAIRRGGVRLLDALRESGKYERIILVGHSLGSVIAYDMVRFAWESYRGQYAVAPPPGGQKSLKRSEKLCARFAELTPQECGELSTEFRDCQRELWRELRQLGNPWLVTDLVTVGSPLAYADFLMAGSFDEFAEMKKYGVLPMCPPTPEDKGGCSYSGDYEFEGVGQRTLKVLASRSPFACIRWTNVYFPGDLIGGPLAPVFGWGIDDRRVLLEGSWLRWVISYTPLVHTRYWSKRGKLIGDHYPERDAVRGIRYGMELENCSLLGPRAEADGSVAIGSAAAVE